MLLKLSKLFNNHVFIMEVISIFLIIFDIFYLYNIHIILFIDIL